MTAPNKPDLEKLSFNVCELVQAVQHIISTAHLDAHICGTGLNAVLDVLAEKAGELSSALAT
jgi:hypothetical protein